MIRVSLRSAVGLPVLLAGALFALGGCGVPAAAERAITASLDTAVAAVNEERASPVVGLIAPEYRDGQGRGRDEMEDLVRGWFLSFSDMRITVRTVDFATAEGGAVSTRVELLASGRRGFGLPDTDAMEVQLEWVETGPGRWQVRSAQWRRLRT